MARLFVTRRGGATVHDVVNQIVFEDLHDIVVAASSYEGAFVRAALAHVHERTREVVRIDAFVPADGDTVSSLSGLERSPLVGLDDEWLVPPPDRRYDDPIEVAWHHGRHVLHPVRCFTEPIRLTKPIGDYSLGLKATAESRDEHSPRLSRPGELNEQC